MQRTVDIRGRDDGSLVNDAVRHQFGLDELGRDSGGQNRRADSGPVRGGRLIRAWSGDRHGATGLGVEVSSDPLAMEANVAPEAAGGHGVGRAEGPGKLKLRQASTGLPIANRHLPESRSPQPAACLLINLRTTHEQRANNRRLHCVSKHQRVSIGIATCDRLSKVRADGLHVCRFR